jgi:hypothetical protein
MNLSVAGLIATTGQGSPGLSRLIPALARQTFPLRGITIVYDGILPKETALPVCPLPLSWIGNPGREPLTRLLNQAIAAMPEDFVLWLNDDVVPENNFVEICAAAMGKDPRIGMVTGKILRMDRRTIDTTGQFLSRDRRAMERGYGSTDIGRFNSGGFVFGAAARRSFTAGRCWRIRLWPRVNISTINIIFFLKTWICPGGRKISAGKLIMLRKRSPIISAAQRPSAKNRGSRRRGAMNSPGLIPG